jgi:hypothetical protein
VILVLVFGVALLVAVSCPAAVAVALLGRTIERTGLFTAAWLGPEGLRVGRPRAAGPALRRP